MAKTLSQLKKNRKASFETLQKEVEKVGGNSGAKTKEGYWKPAKNKEGAFLAVIRFMPPPPDGEFGEETASFVQYVDHYFRGPKGVYNNPSLTNLGGAEDPVSKFQNALWSIGSAAAKTQYGNQKRRVKYISNILVINDPVNPENNGKVFLYEYPKTILDKIKAVVTPPKETLEEPIDIFDPWEGANFKLSATMKKDGDKEFPDYATSGFQKQTPLFDGDEDKITEVWKQCKSLKAFVTAENKDLYKTYDELEAELVSVMGVSSFDELLDSNYIPYTGGSWDKPSAKALDNIEASASAQTDKLRSMLNDDEEEDNIPTEFGGPEKTVTKQKEKKAAPTIEDIGDDLADLQDLADFSDV